MLIVRRSIIARLRGVTVILVTPSSTSSLNQAGEIQPSSDQLVECAHLCDAALVKYDNQVALWEVVQLVHHHHSRGSGHRALDALAPEMLRHVSVYSGERVIGQHDVGAHVGCSCT